MKKLAASFKDVSYSYASRLIIDQVSFDLETGSITTLIGPNGAGKTTIAKLLTGITKAQKGKILSSAREVSYAPQNIKTNQNLPITSKDYLHYIAPDHLLSPIRDIMLDFMNFTKIESIDVANLSGGQRQRLVLASSILKSGDLIVLDEPTQSLDINGQEEFYHLLEEIRNAIKTTIFIISHDLFTVMKNSDQVLCLNHHICCKGTPTHTVIKGTDGLSFYKHHHNHKH